MKHHGLFQGVYYFHFIGADPNARDRFKDHPYYQATVDFCANYDQNSFDPGYEWEPLEFFELMVRRVLAEPVNLESASYPTCEPWGSPDDAGGYGLQRLGVLSPALEVEGRK